MRAPRPRPPRGHSTWFKHIVRAAIDTVLPRSCAACALSLEPGASPLGWCPPCLRLLNVSADRCPCCGLRGDPGACVTCRRHPPAFERTIVVTDYAPPVDRLIHAFKFGRDLSLARPLGALAAEHLRRTGITCRANIPTVITAIPLSTTRLASRGFNQSLELARAISANTGIALDRTALRRLREGPAQALLDPHARQRNARGAFGASAQAGRHVIVVDDVMTTGATLNAAALALKAAGAVRITNLVIARTPEHDVQRRSGPA